MGMSKKARNANFWKKNRRRPNVEQSYLRKSNTSILFYVYNILVYIHIYTSRKATRVPYEFTLLYRNLKKSLFPQISFFGNVFPYQDDFLLKTKMVRMVPRNILYSVDLKICDSKSWFGTKSQNRHFQKWGMKIRN